jgi:DNA polymerase III gamma/tau subunit
VEELEVALKRIIDAEKIHIEAQGIRLIAESVDGSFRDAVKLLEQISFHTGDVSLATVQQILSISTEALRDEFLHKVVARDPKGALAIIASLSNSGQDIKVFTVDCLRTLEKHMVACASGVPTSGWSIEVLTSLIRVFTQAFVDMKGSAIVQLPLELAVVEYCQVPTVQNAQPSPSLSSPVPTPTFAVQPASQAVAAVESAPIGSLSLEKIAEHWADIIAHVKPFNNSIAGVMRSTRPKAVSDGIVVIEAFYTFHKDKLSEPKTKEVLADVLKRLFGEKVKVEVVLGKK